jgi:hypothetical protein
MIPNPAKPTFNIAFYLLFSCELTHVGPPLGVAWPGQAPVLSELRTILSTMTCGSAA